MSTRNRRYFQESERIAPSVPGGNVVAFGPMRVGLIAFLLSAAFGGADEFHQTFVPSRTGSLVDVGWDCLGAVLALIAYAVCQVLIASTPTDARGARANWLQQYHTGSTIARA